MTECRTWSQRRRLLMCAGWSYQMNGYGNGVQWESRNRLASMTDDEFRELLGLNKEDNVMDSSIEIKEENNELVVSSREVADNFGKRHADVLESIENIKTENSAVTSMFYKSSYKAGTGKSYKMYFMNRDGFALLVMGFTGKKALQWKLKYIAAFNAMEKSLRSMPSLPNFANPVEAARAWADAEEGRVKALDVVDDLQVKLGESMKWMSIKQVAKFNSLTYHDISWRKLKATGYETKDVYDANYGSVKAYRVEAWRKAYPDLELPQEDNE